MRGDIFSWIVGTAIVSTVVMFIGQQFGGDFVIFGLAILLGLLSIILLNKFLPGELNFITGATIAVIILATIAISDNVRNSIEELCFLFFIFGIVFIVGGFIGKWVGKDRKRITDKWWFWLVLGLIIVSAIVGSIFILVNLNDSYIPQRPPETCITDADCAFEGTCIDSICYIATEETIEEDFGENWVNSWTEDGNLESEYWHVIEKEGDYIAEGIGHAWLRSDERLANLNLIELKMKKIDGSVNINFLTLHGSGGNDRYLFEIEEDTISLYQQEGQENFILLEQVEYNINENAWYDINIDLNKGIKLYLNNELILENVNVPEYDLAYFSIETQEDSKYQFDDIGITYQNLEPLIVYSI